MKEKIEQYKKAIRELENQLVGLLGNITFLEQKKEDTYTQIAKLQGAIEALMELSKEKKDGDIRTTEQKGNKGGNRV